MRNKSGARHITEDSQTNPRPPLLPRRQEEVSVGDGIEDGELGFVAQGVGIGRQPKASGLRLESIRTPSVYKRFPVSTTNGSEGAVGKLGIRSVRNAALTSW